MANTKSQENETTKESSQTEGWVTKSKKEKKKKKKKEQPSIEETNPEAAAVNYRDTVDYVNERTEVDPSLFLNPNNGARRGKLERSISAPEGRKFGKKTRQKTV